MTRNLARAAVAGLLLAAAVAPATSAAADDANIVELCEPPEDQPNGVKIYPPYGLAEPIKICFLGPA